MKLYNVVKSLGTVGLGLMLATSVSCTDKVGDNDINVVNNGTTATKAADAKTAVGLLQKAVTLIHDAREHKYQYQFSLHIDNYAGYLLVANKLQGRLPRTYSPNASFETGPRANLLWVAQQVVPVINSAKDLKRPELGAIARILYDFSALEMTDVYGPMPYKDHLALKSEPPIAYEKVSEVYKQIFASLKEQQQALKDLDGKLTAEQKADLVRFDRLAGGDIKNWVKFANSIRMRMAMRIVKVAPELAKAEFESAYNDGALTEDDQDIELTGGGRHPLYVISENWDDTRLNANLANLLKRLHHPALQKWFTPVPSGFKDMNGKEVLTSPEYVGMRSGMGTYAKEESIFAKSYKKFSKISSDYASKPVMIFKACEVQFLLAEAKLRGWNVPETAYKYYITGIATSFEREGLGSSSTYRKQKADACPQIPYIDYWNNKYNLPKELCGSKSLAVKYDKSASQEKQLEQIITQKYIANYPLSLEAWCDFRRTGYPVMLPIVDGDSGDGSMPPAGWKPKEGVIAPDRYTHRIPFVKTGSVALNDINTTAKPALQAEDTSMFGGADLQATHIWWDVAGKGNF